MTTDKQHIVVTGGAGYIGSLLTAQLLHLGYRVTVIDTLLFGGESLLTFLSNPDFHFSKSDVTDSRCLKNALRREWPKPFALFHLAGIVGFPACQAIGNQAANFYNVDATKNILEQSKTMGIEKFIFSSTYSVYGMSLNGVSVKEDSPLNPQSLYAETKIKAEEILLPAKAIVFRLATLYGISPRTRFDLIINQFVLDAFTKRELLIYQRGYTRSFVHVRDVIDGLLLALTSLDEKNDQHLYNLGTEDGTFTKDQIVQMVIKRLPDTFVEYKDLTFGGDMRDISVSFEKITHELGFIAKVSVDEGIKEVVNTLRLGLIREPNHIRYRNSQFIVS
jgi:nucleoside-diphosphate-sugar epimerase